MKHTTNTNTLVTLLRFANGAGILSETLDLLTGKHGAWKEEVAWLLGQGEDNVPRYFHGTLSAPPEVEDAFWLVIRQDFSSRPLPPTQEEMEVCYGQHRHCQTCHLLNQEAENADPLRAGDM